MDTLLTSFGLGATLTFALFTHLKIKASFQITSILLSCGISYHQFSEQRMVENTYTVKYCKRIFIVMLQCGQLKQYITN